jgi:hypothetical protein
LLGARRLWPGVPAQQIADWGGLLGPGDTLDVRIFQLSALVGRSTPKPLTLQF